MVVRKRSMAFYTPEMGSRSFITCTYPALWNPKKIDTKKVRERGGGGERERGRDLTFTFSMESAQPFLLSVRGHMYSPSHQQHSTHMECPLYAALPAVAHHTATLRKQGI